MAWQIDRRASAYWLLSLGLFALPANFGLQSMVQGRPLLLVPMMDLTRCLLAPPSSSATGQPDWLSRCTGPKASAAHLVESTLRHLQPQVPDNSPWQLGYTLQVPLLSLLQPGQKDWQVNPQAVATIVRTVQESQRPLVLYLFSTHFGVNAPVEPELANNPDNIAHTPRGPLPTDSYYGLPIYPWSLASTDNGVTEYRAKVIQALLQGICTLPASARSRIKGITLLGEVHQLFPNFESGMGFEGRYLVSDYSPASLAGFRSHLQSRYRTIQALNQKLGSDYPSFDAILPPAKNIRHETLGRYQEHIDAFAAGQMPITGWVHAPTLPGTAQTVKIFLNGRHIADAPVHLSRQDVRTAHPEFGTADLGWRHDLDFSQLPVGIHRIDLALSQAQHPLIHLGTRLVSVMDKRQSTPVAVPFVPLPAMLPLPAQHTAYTDEPREHASYFYNPLAREWQKFREAQVVHYLQYFNTLIGQSCLTDTPRYTHQILPQFNPGWDSGKFAVQTSLQPMKKLRTGISLYGETSYGRSFSDWIKQSPLYRYGVTEFHPLQAMSAQQLGDVLAEHRDNGARFLSFFLETRWKEQRVSTTPNPFSFDPDNRQHASDLLYSSMKILLDKPRGTEADLKAGMR